MALAPLAGTLIRGEVLQFRDHSDYFVPLRYFTAHELRAGHLPLWNPYSGSGERWLANPQTALFYPPAWIFLVLPFPAAYVLYLAFHLFVLGASAYRVYRRWGDEDAALLGASILVLSGPVLSLLDVQNVLGSVAWLPLVIECGLRIGEVKWWSRSVAALCLVFLAGEPFIAVLAWLLFLITVLHRRTGLKPAACALFTASLAISVQLLPFVETILDSERLSAGSRATAFRESIAPGDLLASVINPGLPGGRLDLLTGSQHFIPSIYLGALTILLGALGAVAMWRKREAGAWLLLAATATLLACAGRISVVASVSHLLGMDLNRYPAKFLPIAAFAIIGLAVFGLASLKELSVRDRAVAMGTGACILLLAITRFASADASIQLFRTVEIFAISIPVIVLILLRPHFVIARWFKTIALVLTALLSIYAAGGMLVSVSFSPVTGFAGLISPNRKVARLLPAAAIDRGAWLSGYTNLFEQRFDAGTAAPVVPQKYLKVYETALVQPRLDLVDALSIGYVLSARDLSVAGYQPVRTVRGVTLFSNPQSLPMMQFFTSVERQASPDQAYARLLGGAFDARTRISVTAPADVDLPRPTPFQAHGNITSLNGTEASFDAETNRECVVVLTQLAAPGWDVRVDGIARPELVVNGLFRGVLVNAGRHHVQWRYRPPMFLAGGVLSLLGLLSWMFFHRRFQRFRAVRVD